MAMSIFCHLLCLSVSVWFVVSEIHACFRMDRAILFLPVRFDWLNYRDPMMVATSVVQPA